MIGSEPTSPQARETRNVFIVGAIGGTLIGLALWATIWLLSEAVSLAFAAEAAAPPSTPLSIPDQVKEIAIGSGAIERPLLGLALTVIGVLFGLLMKSWADRKADVDKAALSEKAAVAECERDHLAALKAKDDAHSDDRAEWHAATTLLQEARVGMTREVLTGLTNATAQIQAAQAIIAERTSTSAEQNGILREVMMSVQSSRQTFAEDTSRLSKRIDAALEALEARQQAPSRRVS